MRDNTSTHDYLFGVAPKVQRRKLALDAGAALSTLLHSQVALIAIGSLIDGLPPRLLKVMATSHGNTCRAWLDVVLSVLFILLYLLFAELPSLYSILFESHIFNST